MSQDIARVPNVSALANKERRDGLHIELARLRPIRVAAHGEPWKEIPQMMEGSAVAEPGERLVEHIGHTCRFARGGKPVHGIELCHTPRTRNAHIISPTPCTSKSTPKTTGTASAAATGEPSSSSPTSTLITPRTNDPSPPPLHPPMMGFFAQAVPFTTQTRLT